MAYYWCLGHSINEDGSKEHCHVKDPPPESPSAASAAPIGVVHSLLLMLPLFLEGVNAS